MNRLQWDLRYPYATEVTGYHAPIAAGGLDDSVEGPVVVPGTYSVVLDYGGRKRNRTLSSLSIRGSMLRSRTWRRA